jgi:hypothetical protein
MKEPIKRKNDEFLAMPFKHVSTVMGFINYTGTTNYAQSLMKMVIKLKNDDFLVMPFMGFVNYPRTSKKWLIAHESANKM